MSVRNRTLSCYLEGKTDDLLLFHKKMFFPESFEMNSGEATSLPESEPEPAPKRTRQLYRIMTVTTSTLEEQLENTSQRELTAMSSVLDRGV